MQPGQYIGNPDYRGYLNYLGQNGDTRAKTLLQFAGNDGVLGGGGVPLNQDMINYNTQLYKQYSSSGGGYGGSGGSAPSGPTEAEKAQMRDFTNRSYDTKISGLRSIFDTLQPQQDAATNQVNNQYLNQQKAVTDQRDMGNRNLNLASETVQAGKVKSLADLRRQVETLGMSYNTQLGNYGAGDSSAAQLIQRGLSGMASKNRSDVLYNANTQERGIDMKRNDLQVEFDNGIRALDDWKAGALNDIATRFMQQRQQIQQQMQNADADRYAALAKLDSNYVNQAIAALGNLETQYRSSANELVNQFRSMTAPQARIQDKNLNYDVSPIEAGQIGGTAVPSVSAGNQPGPAAYRRPFEEDYGISL